MVVLCSSLSSPVAKERSLEDLLQSPLSPGVVGLLTVHSGDSRVVDRLGEGLQNDDPGIRAISARVTGLIKAVKLASNLREALEKEIDLFAAREQMRALATLEGQQAYDAILNSAERLGNEAWQVFADIVVLQDGTRGLRENLTRFYEVLDKDTLRGFVAQALARQTEPIEVLAAHILSASNNRAWHDLLVALHYDGRASLDPNTLLSGLSHASLQIRGETAWHLLGTFRDWPPEFREAMGRLNVTDLSNDGLSDDPDMSFGLELLARALGRKKSSPGAGVELFARDEACHIDQYGMDAIAASHLTSKEYSAAVERYERRFEDRKFRTKRGPPREDEARVIRTLSGFPNGFVKDLREVTGCQRNWSKGTTVQAKITYDALGRPRRVLIVEDAPTEQCRVFAKTLFTMSLTPPLHFPNPEREEHLVLFLGENSVELEEIRFFHWPYACNEGDAVEAAVPPKRTRFVKPEYPAGNAKRRLEGKVTLEIVVSPTGVVKGMRVLKLKQDSFLLSAMKAVGQWRYSPAILGADAVAVNLVVIVEFDLK